MTTRKFFVTSVLLVMMSLVGCSDKEKETVRRRGTFAMDTYMELTAYGDNAEAALTAAEERIHELEDKFSVNIENSDIWRVNHSGGESASVGEDTQKLVETALELGRETNGTLDITLYPVTAAWGFTTENYRIPSDEELNRLLEGVGWQNVSADGGQITVPDGAMIDLGAVAKGYTSDELMEEFRENGVKSAIVSLGGNVHALGRKPDGSCWRVAVRNPFAPEADMCSVEIEDCAVVTSGSYERCFTGDDGISYCHIIDPETGRPVRNGLVSVTVIGKSGVRCDGLSTALFVMGAEKALDFWRKNEGFELILVNDEREILYTDGLSESFANLSDMTAEVVSRA